MEKRVVARWRSRGKFWLDLYVDDDGCFTYRGDGCGGCLGVVPMELAVGTIEERVATGMYGKSVKRVESA